MIGRETSETFETTDSRSESESDHLDKKNGNGSVQLHKKPLRLLLTMIALYYLQRLSGLSMTLAFA
jgi:hypothetical protein